MSDTEEFRFKIEAYSPDTMPMERLANYLAQLAQMLGEPASIHFVRLEPGSTSLIHRIESEAVAKVRARTATVHRGDGPRDSVRAYRAINEMLCEDGGSATWREESTSADILIFPGKAGLGDAIAGISQRGSIDGEVVRIGGIQSEVPVTLKAGDEEVSGISVKRALAKDLARRLFEPVRLFGTGRWKRNDSGEWKLDGFRADGFVPLRECSLSEALSELRAVHGDWTADSLDELEIIRNGYPEVTDGGI